MVMNALNEVPMSLDVLPLLRRPQTCPGDHHGGRETARLSPHTVERPFVCSHHTVHPQMETCESLPLAREAFSKVGIDKVDCSAAWEKDVCVGGGGKCGQAL